ncbi:hypothetical protein J7K25_03170 [bacterium]|nr:hypothetical protein [bacterium]
MVENLDVLLGMLEKLKYNIEEVIDEVISEELSKIADCDVQAELNFVRHKLVSKLKNIETLKGIEEFLKERPVL